jgi:hypothetical protein
MGSLSIKNGTLSLLYSNNGEQREVREGVIREERERDKEKRKIISKIHIYLYF